jgi:CRP-like cAMP-binding protein
MTLQLSNLDKALIRKAAMFGGLDDDMFDALLQRAVKQTFRRGETIFLQGDSVHACFVVLDGWVKLYRLSPTGAEAVVAVFTRGQSFAEAAAFMRGKYPVSGEAATDVTLLSIPCGTLIEQIKRNPEIGLAMLASTSLHLQMLVQQIEQLKAHTGSQRLAEFLVTLCNGETGHCTIGLPYDKALIAGRLGMKPESLSRAFQRLRPMGVKIEHSTAMIEDVGKLSEYASEERGEI